MGFLKISLPDFVTSFSLFLSLFPTNSIIPPSYLLLNSFIFDPLLSISTRFTPLLR